MRRYPPQPTSTGGEAFGVLETHGWTPALVGLDAMEKAATIRVWPVELNDVSGTRLKIVAEVDDVGVASEAGERWASRLGGCPVTRLIPKLSPGG